MSAPSSKALPKAPSSSSWDDGLESTTLIVQGQYGAGKTTLAASIDPSFPRPMPTTKHSGQAKYHLKKCFWICFDKGALVSFRERGIEVQRFDVRKYMAEKKASLVTAVEVGLKEAEKAVREGAEWVIPDTLSSFDKMLDTYCLDMLLAGKSDSMKSEAEKIEQVQIKKYGLMFNWHKLFHNNLMALGCGVIYLTHCKAVIDLGLGDSDTREKQKKVRAMASTAQGGVLQPDITGKGAGVYKADARLQLVVKAVKGVGGKMTREVWAENADGYETKNSWELSIFGKQEPDLMKIMAKVTK